MARKKSSTAETEATNGEPKRGSKTAAIRELIAKGVRSAKEIADEMVRQGLSVSMPVIYTTLKESKNRGKGKARSKQAAPVSAASPVESSHLPSASSADLTAKDLSYLAEITKKAGGVDEVVSLLNVVKHFQ